MPRFSHSAAIATALLLSSTLAAQVTLPPHNNVYDGFTRGYNFVSTIPFLITAVELPLDAQQAGDTASFLVRINNATVLRNVGGTAAMLPTNIQVNVGDSVDILGNWSPATPGNFTAHNSYSASYALPGYSTLIEGVAHNLRRAGWQWDIGDPAWTASGTTGAYLAPVGGQLGRVFIYTAPSGTGTLATNTPIGAGCGASYASYYDFFAAPANYNLNGLAFTMTAASGGYIVSTGGTLIPVGSLGGVVTPLALTDDSEVLHTFTVGSFSGPDGPWPGLAVISNGKVSFATGNSLVGAPSVTQLLANTATAFYFQGDWDPSTGGSVSVEETVAVTTVTWDNVPSWNNAGTSNNFQFQFYSSGDVVIVCGAMATVGSNGGIMVGYSPGGPNLDPGSTDLAALVGALQIPPPTVPDTPALTLTAATRPKLNSNWNLAVSALPAAGTIGVEIYGLSDPGINDLGFLGLPGCGLRASLDYLNAWLAIGALPHAYFLTIPNNMSLVGSHVYATAAVFAPGINAFGAITANGMNGLIGTY